MLSDVAASLDATATDPAREEPLFEAGVQGAAKQLIEGGAVSDVRILHGGCVVTGIAGDRQRVYVRYPHVGATTFDGECSCGERSPCMHIAAVLLTAALRPAASAALGPNVTAPPSSPPASGLDRRAAADQSLCYLIEPGGGGARLSIWVRHLSPDRRTAESLLPFAPRASAAREEHPRYVDARDRAVLDTLTSLQSQLPQELTGTAGFDILQRTLATGRAYWRTLPGAIPLRAESERAVSFVWEVLATGDQRLCCAVAEPLDFLLSLEPPVYIAASGACGPVELPYPKELLHRYWAGALIDPREVPGINASLAADPRAGHFPRLRGLTLQRQALSTVCGQLLLSAGPQAHLQFLYDDTAVDCRPTGCADTVDTVVRRWDGAVIREIARALDVERELAEQLRQHLPATPRTAEGWLAFMMSGVPALQSLGWRVRVAADFPFQLAVVDDWYADLQTSPRPRGKSASREWFDLRLGVRVDGRAVNLLPALVSYLQGAARRTGGQHDALSLVANEHLLVRLDDGRHLPVPLARIQRIADTLVELCEQDGLNGHQALTLPAAQAGRLAQLPFAGEVPLVRSEAPALLRLIDAVTAFSGIEPLCAPAHFPATLRPYQEEGLGWLQFLRRHGLGGILADDMGLGKTVQTLAHLVIEKQQGRLRKPSLIVAPVSVLGNWQQEIRRFAPGLTVLVLQGARRRERFTALGNADIVLIGYPLLVVDRDLLLPHEFCFVILDEAQTIKNPQARVSQVAQALRAEHRLCLTGTPMENHLGELWSLTDFVQPGLLGERQEFQRLYRAPIENEGDLARAAALSRRLKPFLLRRTKDAVARELPPKMQIVEAIELEEQQRDFYDSIRLGQHRRVREAIAEQGVARSHLTVLNALLKLRQACCDPRLVDADAAARRVPSAKLDWLASALPELIAEGRRILLFSQFTSMLTLIEEQVNDLAIPYCLLTGKTRLRAEVVERFQAGAVPLFLLSLKAGGTGLNLTAADTIIHYDPWWNPAVEAQATDRAHRIGQDKPVFVYKLIAQGTVEEKILQLQVDKHALVTQLYTAGDASPAQLTAADLEALFAP